MTQFVFFLAVVANSLDLVVTTLGIHWLRNREGNPLLAGLAHHHWWLFVLIKGLVVPILMVKLYQSRTSSPRMTAAGLAIIVMALVVALGQWLGWMAGVLATSPTPAF